MVNGLVKELKSDNTIGCLGIIALVLGFFWCMHYFERADARKSAKAIESTRLLSHNSNPDTFFPKLVDSWSDVRDIGGIAVPGQPSIHKLQSGKYLVQLRSGIGDAKGMKVEDDLGENAKANSVEFIATLARMCEGKLDFVDAIDVDLETKSDAMSISYIAEFRPDAALAKSIVGESEVDLKSDILRKLVTLADTASGTHWVRVPTR